jgi:hypothetical protein
VTEEQELAGGVANKGSVVRVGGTVRRPSGPNTPASSRLLRHLEAVVFEGAPRFQGIDDDGRETLSYIPGDVPLPVFPAWSMTDEVLIELGALMRRFHDATVALDRAAVERWSDELTDPVGGDVICHNDICPENVVLPGRSTGCHSRLRLRRTGPAGMGPSDGCEHVGAPRRPRGSRCPPAGA